MVIEDKIRKKVELFYGLLTRTICLFVFINVVIMSRI